MAAVTSVMRVQQILIARLNELLRPWSLTFPRYEALLLLFYSRAGSLPLGKMGERLQVEFQFREVDFTHSFKELREGRSDVAMSVFRDVNPEPDLDHLQYLDPGTAFLVPEGNPLGIRSPDDLCGLTVARPLTTPAEALARQSRRASGVLDTRAGDEAAPCRQKHPPPST